MRDMRDRWRIACGRALRALRCAETRRSVSPRRGERRPIASRPSPRSCPLAWPGLPGGELDSTRLGPQLSLVPALVPALVLASSWPLPGWLPRLSPACPSPASWPESQALQRFSALLRRLFNLKHPKTHAQSSDFSPHTPSPRNPNPSPKIRLPSLFSSLMRYVAGLQLTAHTNLTYITLPAPLLPPFTPFPPPRPSRSIFSAFAFVCRRTVVSLVCVVFGSS